LMGRTPGCFCKVMNPRKLRKVLPVRL
jgi:hypothetical protein